MKLERNFTYLFTFLFVALALFVVGVLAPVAVAVWIVSQKCIVCLTGGFDLVLCGRIVFALC